MRHLKAKLRHYKLSSGICQITFRIRLWEHFKIICTIIINLLLSLLLQVVKPDWKDFLVRVWDVKWKNFVKPCRNRLLKGFLDIVVKVVVKGLKTPWNKAFDMILGLEIVKSLKGKFWKRGFFNRVLYRIQGFDKLKSIY